MIEKSNLTELLESRYKKIWEDEMCGLEYPYPELTQDHWERTWRQHVRCLFGKHVWKPLRKDGVCPQCKKEV